MKSADFGEVLWPGLRALYGLTYNEWPEEFSQVFEIATSTKYKEEDVAFSGFGYLAEKEKGGSIIYDEAYQRYKTTYTHATYALGFNIERELWEDDQYRIIQKYPKALARSNRQTIELLAATHLNLSHASGSAGGDGQPLVSSSHPIIGGTASNLGTPADLSVSSLEQAFIDIGNFVDERGMKMRAMPRKLIVSTSNAWNARVILGSVQKPGTANNDLNPARDALPGGVVVLHWLTSATKWFIQTDVPDGLIFFWRRRPEFSKDNDFDTENAKFKTTLRCSLGHTDWRAIYGNAGA